MDWDNIEIKPKYELKDKETALLPAVKQLLVKLGWTSAVDLDLMAFWETKAGEKGGVFTAEISGDIKTLGSLDQFPFMQLSGDAGVGKEEEGEEEEELRITKLDDIQKLYLVALNYDAAKEKDLNASFADYNGHIRIVDDEGNNFDIPLESQEKGTVALVATIENTATGAKLKREDTVMSFVQFVQNTPGAMELVK